MLFVGFLFPQIQQKMPLSINAGHAKGKLTRLTAGVPSHKLFKNVKLTIEKPSRNAAATVPWVKLHKASKLT